MARKIDFENTRMVLGATDIMSTRVERHEDNNRGVLQWMLLGLQNSTRWRDITANPLFMPRGVEAHLISWHRKRYINDHSWNRNLPLPTFCATRDSP